MPAVSLIAGLSVALSGCGAQQDELIPVSGKVLLGGKPLHRGVLVLSPDTAKGNTTLHEPRGELDAQGNYTLNTSGREGAPAGWYKVAVIATKEEPRKGPGPPPEWLAPPRYVDPATSHLAIEVKKGAPPGSYDLQLNR